MTLRIAPQPPPKNKIKPSEPCGQKAAYDGSIAEPIKLIGTDYPYSDGQRTLQVDAVVFNKDTGTLVA